MNPDPTPVDRCVCHQVTFTELIRLHRETGADLEGLQGRTRCGTSCGMCLPYIRIALQTGRARLPVLLATDRQLGWSCHDGSGK